MKKIIFTLVLIASTGFLFAQNTGRVGINIASDVEPKATLDISAKTDAGAQAEGILIPRVDRAKAQAMTGVLESTMIYVNDATTADQTGTTVDVDAKGFYYFGNKDGVDKWIKVGGASEPKKTIRSVIQIKQSEWANDQFALVTTTGADVELPDPAANVNRIIAVNNQHNASVNFTLNPPANNSALMAGKGFLLMSDGTKWYVIGGSY